MRGKGFGAPLGVILRGASLALPRAGIGRAFGPRNTPRSSGAAFLWGLSRMAPILTHFGTVGGGGVSVWEIAHLASRSEGGTGFQAVLCDSHSQDGCATLVSTDGTRISQRSPLGDFQRRVSSQTILN